MRLAVRVQHHPSRAHLLPELLDRLDGLNPQVIIDPGGRQVSSWRTHRLCLESLPDDATHLLVMQDDALPCAGFADAARAAITERPERIIAFFVSGIGHIARRVNLARKQGARWLEFPQTSYIPLVATVYPAHIARQIPAFFDAKRIAITRADDAVVGQFCRAHRLTACATLPSLVEHRDVVASVTGMPSGRGSPHRVAAWFVDTDANAAMLRASL